MSTITIGSQPTKRKRQLTNQHDFTFPITLSKPSFLGNHPTLTTPIPPIFQGNHPPHPTPGASNPTPGASNSILTLLNATPISSPREQQIENTSIDPQVRPTTIDKFRFTNPVSTVNTLAIEATRNHTRTVSFQTSTHIDSNYNNTSFISLQEPVNIPATALKAWRNARAALNAEAKAEARAEHLHTLSRSTLIPYWAIGAEPLPGYLNECLPDLVRIRNHHATELVNTAKDYMYAKATHEGEMANAYLQATETLFGNIK